MLSVIRQNLRAEYSNLGDREDLLKGKLHYKVYKVSLQITKELELLISLPVFAVMFKIILTLYMALTERLVLHYFFITN